MDVDDVAWANGTVNVQIHQTHAVRSQHIAFALSGGLTVSFRRPEILKMSELNDSSELQIYAVSNSSFIMTQGLIGDTVGGALCAVCSDASSRVCRGYPESLRECDQVIYGMRFGRLCQYPCRPDVRNSRGESD